MAIISLSPLWRFVVEGHVVTVGGNTRKVYNVFHYLSSGTPQDTPGNRGAFAARFNTLIWSFIAAQLSSDYVADQISTWKMTDGTDSLTPAAVQNSGAVGGVRLSTNQAVFGYTGGGLRGPSWHGSKRYGPIPISQVTGDELTPAAHTAWEAAHAKSKLPWTANIGGHLVLFQPVILSRVLSNPNPPPAAQVGCNLTVTYCDITLSSWRHRREQTQR